MPAQIELLFGEPNNGDGRLMVPVIVNLNGAERMRETINMLGELDRIRFAADSALRIGQPDRMLDIAAETFQAGC